MRSWLRYTATRRRSSALTLGDAGMPAQLVMAEILPWRKMFAPVRVRGYRYIDPTAPTNGDGSFASPYNAWGVTDWWQPGLGYMQCAETEYNAEIVVYNNGPYFIGTYDPATGLPIRDNTRHARVRPASGRALSLGTMATDGRNNISVDNLDLRAPRTIAPYTEGIANTTATPDTRLNVQVRRCLLDGRYGAQMKGAGLLFEDCTVNGFDGGLSLQSTWFRVSGCDVIHIVDPGTPFVDYDPEWGGITNTLAATDQPDSVIVENCTVDGAGSWKQCVHLMAGVGVAAPPSLGEVRISGNSLHNYKQPIYCSMSDAVIENNEFVNVYAAPDALPTPDAWAISIVANNCTVRNNTVSASPTARFLNIAATGGTTRIENNVVRGVREGIAAKSGTHTVVMRDNTITRAALDGTAEDDASLLWVLNTITLDVSGSKFGWTDGSPVFTSGGAVRTFAQFQAQVDPTAQQVAA